MLYLNKDGIVRPKAGAERVKSFVELTTTSFVKKGNAKAIQDILTFVYYMYSNDDMNTYKYLFPAERKEEVIEYEKLFDWHKGDIEDNEAVSIFIDDFYKYCRTPSERMRDTLIARMEKIRKEMILSELNTPAQEKQMFEAILAMQKLLNELEKEVHVEQESEDWKENLRLFELPNDQWQ